MGRGSSGAGTQAKGVRASRGAGTGGGGGGGGGPIGGAASGPARPAGSKATVIPGVDYTPSEQAALSRAFMKMIGRGSTVQDAASLVGAPDNARVTISHLPNPGGTEKFSISVRAPGLTAERDIYRNKQGQLVIKNQFIEVAATGQGTGAKMFGRQVEFASAAGVSAIRTEASSAMGFNGYYTWARLGYNAKLSPGVRESLPAGLQGARSVHELFKTEAGRNWWKANGKTTDMRFNLNPGSRSRKILTNYLQEKGL